MTEKPYLLVDVDGVLNIFGWDISKDGAEADDPTTWGPHLEKVFIAEGYAMRVPSGTSERIGKLEQMYQCVWATTWEEAAPRDLGPHLGFGTDWPVIELTVGRAFTTETWKLPSIEKWDVDPSRTLAWLDDDLHDDADMWASDRKGLTFLARCDHETGLTQALADQLEAFVFEEVQDD